MAKYTEALALDPERPNTLYNLGLVYKYRRAWRESFEYRRRAAYGRTIVESRDCRDGTPGLGDRPRCVAGLEDIL